MALDRVRTAAALLLLACLALPTYTCEGQRYIGPGGAAVGYVPDSAIPAGYHREQIAHYPLESTTSEPVRNSLVVLAYSWPVLFFAYRRRRVAAIPRWSMWLSPMFAVLSGYFILMTALLGRPAIGAYLALTADAVLFADGVAEAWTASQRGRASALVETSGGDEPL
jgi:hypothetical protein